MQESEKMIANAIENAIVNQFATRGITVVYHHNDNMKVIIYIPSRYGSDTADNIRQWIIDENQFFNVETILY